MIIGGGISGLTAGVYGAKSGFEVEIYEKHSIVGGECTGWDRQGYHIDNCIHWLMGTTEGTALNKIWQDVGAIGEGIEIIKSDKMYTSELDGERITLWEDINRTEQELMLLSPEDEVEIKKLMKFTKLSKNVQIPAEKPSEMFGLIDGIKMGITMKDTMKVFKEYAGMDTNDLMNRFKHPLIRCMISDFCTKESLASSFPMAYGNFTSGDGGVPRGGSRALAFRMQKKFESYGGKVYTNASVQKVVLEDDKAKGIQLSDGTVISADYVICACDTDYTFGTLLPKSYMEPLMKEMYENRKAYPVYGMFQIAFAVDCDVDVVGTETIIDFRDLQFASWVNDRLTIKSYGYEPDFAPKGKQIIQILLGLTEDSYDYWSELYKDKEAYCNRKEEIAQQIMKKVEERFPEYKGKLTILDIWTPMTYKRYCNAYKGYNQAFMITKYSAKRPYPSAYVEGLENVILAGQWISPPGGLPGAAITGKFAIQRILKKEKRSIKL
ncbi:phytoene desaturase family protein [Gottschalkia purinilytica]|uniref:phytoene desaturase family protein n=1 Tax=Gottschalkia purinilytica TaxID=1503 RepID=UPI0012FEE666|nr:NAD(P)/FAD-dependent oxidoreductase [Gottschalkia purinilytica]